MMSQNASLAVGFKGAADLNGVPMYVHQLPLTLGGVIDPAETADPIFGRLVSTFPNEPHNFLVGVPPASIPRGVLIFDAAISENDPAKPDAYIPGAPATIALYGPLQYKRWGMLAPGAIEPVIGCKVIAATDTGIIGFLPSTEVVAPAGYIFVNASVIDKEFGANGVTVFFGNAGLGSAQEFPVAATPTADPIAGPYVGPQSVALASTTPGATIYYTVDGTEPDETDTEYILAIAVAATTTIRARAFAAGFAPSDVLTAVYTIS
jgi:hypothetical protein